MREKKERVNKIIVLGDGETYDLEGYVVALTDEEMMQVEAGSKVSLVVGWNRLLAGTVTGTLFSPPEGDSKNILPEG
tara:strand:+ start:1462 stop:1692 length:231 start_codon:yes stop_codon:yes gene_type:complete